MPRKEDHEVHKDMWDIGQKKKITVNPYGVLTEPNALLGMCTASVGVQLAVLLRYTQSPLAVHPTRKFLLLTHYFLSRYELDSITPRPLYPQDRAYDSIWTGDPLGLSRVGTLLFPFFSLWRNSPTRAQTASLSMFQYRTQTHHAL